MKNVIIFQDFIKEKTYGHSWKEEELFAYFRAQIDNSLRLGWKPEDIVICTNLDFEYKNVTIIRLEDICQYNKYFNKQYGIAELLTKELITEPFWFHDFDDWQLVPLSFPEFKHSIGMCKYINFTQWNTGSIFIKPNSAPIWTYIVDFMKLNKDNKALLQTGDENVFNFIYNNSTHWMEVTELSPAYNVGVTGFESRLAAAGKQVYVAAFKPGSQGYELFKSKGLIPTDLNEIFKSHGLV